MNTSILSSNLEKLKDYPYYYGKNIIDLSNTEFKDNCININSKKLCDNPVINSRILITNISKIDYLLQVERLSNKEDITKFKKIPFYLYYENYGVFLQLITKNDITPLLVSNRVVFLIGEACLKEYFKDLQTVLPNDVYGYNYCNIEEIIKEIADKREQQLEQIHKEIIEYYETNDKKVVNNILSGKSKILFIKCRFSYVIKNHTRDSCEAFKRLGYDTVISVESSDINRIYREADINKHKPDIIFDIDHFRYNYNFQLPNVVYITWIQDPYPRLFNEEIPKKLTKRDIILNYFISFKDIYDKYGYNKKYMIDAPIPGNELLYKKYNLSTEEKSKYSSDICYVSNCNNYKALTLELITKYRKEIQISFKSFVDWYYQKEYEQIFIMGYQIELLYSYFERFLSTGLLLTKEEKSSIKDDLFKIQYTMKKYIIARWITELKELDISLWGNDWNQMAEFKKFSKGEAKNGEELSKIYNASKICIGTHPQTTSSARVFEILLSGSLCIQQNIDVNYDIASYRLIADNDINGLAFYNTKEELFEKINYFIKNNDERIKVSEYGCRQAQSKFTYTNLAKKTINYITQIFNSRLFDEQ